MPLSKDQIATIMAQGAAGKPQAPGVPAFKGGLPKGEIASIMASVGVAPPLGAWGEIKSTAWEGLGGLFWALDLVRRVPTTGLLALGDRTMAEAWETSQSGQQMIRELDPQWAEEHPKWAWGLGVGLEIATDPLTWLTFGGLTATGQAAKKAGKLGFKTARQVARGQRALLQVTVPTGGLGPAFRRIGLVKAPRAVAAIAAGGRYMGSTRPFSWFRVGSLNPYARHAARVAEQAGADVSMQLTRLTHAAQEIRKQTGPEMWEAMRDVGEHLGRVGKYHTEIVDAAAPEVVEWARKYKGLIDSADDIADGFGMRVGKLGGSIRHALNQAGRAQGKEVLRLKKTFDNMIGTLAGKQRKFLDASFAKRAKARVAWDGAIEAADKVWDARRVLDMEAAGKPLSTWPTLAKKAAKEERLLTPLSNRLSRQARKAEIAARDATFKASRMADQIDGIRKLGIVPSKKQIALDARIAKLHEMEELVPNWMHRYLAPKALRQVLAYPAIRKSLKAITWTDDLHGRIARKMVERFDYVTLKKLGPYEHAAREITREMDARDILKLLKDPAAGTRLEAYRTVAEGGFLDRLKDWWRGAPRSPKLKNFYEQDIAKNFERYADHITEAIKGRSFVDEIATNPGIFSKVPREGWMQIKDVSVKLSKYTGPGWLHPEAFTEMRRLYSQALNPQSTLRLVRAYQYATGLFKMGVTGPWPAYHFRNFISDFVLMTYNGATNPVRVINRGINAMLGKGTFKVAGQTMDGKDFRRLAEAHGVTFGELRSYGAARWMQWMENMRRTGYFAERLEMGFSPFAAAMETKKVLFDFRQMSAADNVLKNVIPFWGWAKNNVRLQVQTLFTHPAPVMAQVRFGARAEKIEEVPPWIRGRMMLALSPDEQTGEERLLTGIGLPVEDITELLDFSGGFQDWWKQLSFRANPFLKMGIGAISGYDMDRARQMDRPVTAPYLKWAYDNLDEDKVGVLERWLGARKRRTRAGETYYTVGPFGDFLMRNLPTSRAYNTLKQAAREDRSPYAKALQFGTGLSVIPYDPQKSKADQEKRAAQQIVRRSQRRGDMGQFAIPYARRGARLSPEEQAALRRIERR